MNWIKEKLYKVILLVLIFLFICLGYLSYVYYYKPKIEFKKKNVAEAQRKEDFKNRFNEYSNMINVGLCQEVYNEFITNGSKERKGDNFFAHCKYRKEQWGNINIITTVFNPEYERVDVKYNYDLNRANLNSIEFDKCMGNFFADYQLCEKTAPKEILKKDSVETWLLEDGKWKRDY